uniref:ARAD1B17930p n=1 Tax=Blastobotrys adeninivorans TaxID=409370 RepID=A0A060TCP3_BLAAD
MAAPRTPPPGSPRDPLPTPLPSGEVYKGEQPESIERKSAPPSPTPSRPKSRSSGLFQGASPDSDHDHGHTHGDDASNIIPPPFNGRSQSKTGDDYGGLLSLDEPGIRQLSDDKRTDLLVDAISALKDCKNRLLHAQIQNQMLTIESHESTQRFLVEHNISKREIDRLRANQQTSNESLESAETYRRRLTKAKIRLRASEHELAEKSAEIEKLRKIIRQSRLELERERQWSHSRQYTKHSDQQYPVRSLPQSPITSREDGQQNHPGGRPKIVLPPIDASFGGPMSPQQGERSQVSPKVPHQQIPKIQSTSTPSLPPPSPQAGLETLGMLATQVLEREGASRQGSQDPSSPTTKRRGSLTQPNSSASSSRELRSPLTFSEPQQMESIDARRQSTVSTIDAAVDQDDINATDIESEQDEDEDGGSSNRHITPTPRGHKAPTTPPPPPIQQHSLGSPKRQNEDRAASVNASPSKFIRKDSHGSRRPMTSQIGKILNFDRSP